VKYYFVTLQKIEIMKRLIIYLLLFIPVLSFAQYEPKHSGQLIRHTYYSLDYNATHKQANWVYYRLTYDMIKGKTKRSDSFRPDPAVSFGASTLADYKGSGYDRGHLCPAADMKISEKAMSETFFLSNMSPQFPAFNRGKWADLEKLVRSYIKDISDTLYIVTGPVFISNKGSIGQNKVTIPGFYYKAIYSPKRGGIGFLMPNVKIELPLKAWVVSIDFIEMLTGIDFFHQLDDKIENRIESQAEWWK